MHKLTIDNIKSNGLLIFEVISGSRAYGLETATSDTDIKGVFVLPKDMFYGLEYTPQVNNETNDVVYYELKRFMELLAKNNPNMLEMLCSPPHCVLQKHPVMDMLQPEMFVSKLCEQSFANYAFTQIKKAYGLEKKIVQPMEETRKSVLDFCFVYQDKEAVPLEKYLGEKGWDQSRAGLTAIQHLRDCYNLYYSDLQQYSGVMRKENANDVSLSSIPKGEQPVAMLYFNKDGYSVYCKQYREYQDWVAKRNEQRYNTTTTHGKKYDSKNMMHVFRLLLVAKEIATEGKVNVHRKDRDFLLAIKAGKFEYDELVQQATALKDELPLLYEQSNLIAAPDMEMANKLLIKIREVYYGAVTLYPALIDYIYRYYTAFQTTLEKLAAKRFLHDTADKDEAHRKMFIKLGWFSDDAEVNKIFEGGFEAFRENVAVRIYREHKDELELNLCPVCGKVARTPQARQCRFCRYDWH